MNDAGMGNNYYMSTDHDIVLVPVAGNLCAHAAPGLRRMLDVLLKGDCKRIVLNMQDVPHIDAQGLNVIISALSRMRSSGRLLSLVNVSPDVLRSLRIARLVDLMPVSVAGERREVPELDPSAMPLWCKTLRVDTRDLHAVRARVEELANRLAFTDDDVFDLTLAVGEAVGNAVDHTCGKGVLATISAYPDRMIVEVTDCGNGFGLCADEIPCVSNDEERGRGIRLMRLLVDSVTIENRPSGTGTVVRLVKLV